jgi:hypothetical protein
MTKYTPEQVQILKQEYKSLEQEMDRLERSKRETDHYGADRHNNICPKCDGKDIVDKIKRIQGSMDGSLDGGFFLGCGSISGRVHGELDTNEIRYCKTCTTEWKKREKKWSFAQNALYDMYHPIQEYFEKKEDAKNVKFDPSDLSEKFSSKEEKAQSVLAQAKKEFAKDSIIRKYHAEAVREFIQDQSSFDLYSFMKDVKTLSLENYVEWGCPRLVDEEVKKTVMQRIRSWFT